MTCVYVIHVAYDNIICFHMFTYISRNKHSTWNKSNTNLSVRAPFPSTYFKRSDNSVTKMFDSISLKLSSFWWWQVQSGMECSSCSGEVKCQLSTVRSLYWGPTPSSAAPTSTNAGVLWIYQLEQPFNKNLSLPIWIPKMCPSNLTVPTI